MEYQERRLHEIGNQYSRFEDVRKILANTKEELTGRLDGLQLKKRHSKIDPQTLLEGVETVFSEFTEQLNDLEREQPGVHDKDLIRERIDRLLEGNVGDPPSVDQLDGWYEDGASRYEREIPPGYSDSGKNGIYQFGNLVLKKRYGDLILWNEILEEATNRGDLSGLVFVTDDSKEDWWWGERGKTIGPRPELVQEICSNRQVNLFYMYSSSRLMHFAEDYLEVEIGEDSPQQAEDISKNWEELSKSWSEVSDTIKDQEDGYRDLFGRKVIRGTDYTEESFRFSASKLETLNRWIDRQYVVADKYPPSDDSSFSFILVSAGTKIGIKLWNFVPGEDEVFAATVKDAFKAAAVGTVDKAHFVVAAGSVNKIAPILERYRSFYPNVDIRTTIGEVVEGLNDTLMFKKRYDLRGQ